MADPLPVDEAKLCRIERILGHTEACPEERCSFWEPGGAAEGRCVFERVDLADNRSLATWLLHIRSTIEQDE